MQDLETIANTIRGDPYILRAMNLTDKSQQDKIKYIMTRRAYDGEQVSNLSYINVYYAPSRKLTNKSFYDTVVQIDILFPYSKSNTAQMVSDQIEALLDNYMVNGKYLDTDVSPYDNSTGATWYTISMRFNFYKAKGTPKLKQ